MYSAFMDLNDDEKNVKARRAARENEVHMRRQPVTGNIKIKEKEANVALKAQVPVPGPGARIKCNLCWNWP